jgi:hypothetical protein
LWFIYISFFLSSRKPEIKIGKDVILPVALKAFDACLSQKGDELMEGGSK